MTDLLALIVVVTTGLYFIGLGIISFWIPSLAARFLGGFASSAGAHYLELFLRLVAGAAFLARASSLWATPVFTAFGWMLIVTTTALLLIPWRWHRRFAEQSVPRAVRYLPLIGGASFAMGAFIVAAALCGRT